MARSDPQFNLRIPQELKEQIEKSAKDDGRSVNAQAVHLLQSGLKNQKPPTQIIAPIGIAPPNSVEQKLDQILTEIQSLKSHPWTPSPTTQSPNPLQYRYSDDGIFYGKVKTPSFQRIFK